MAMLKEREYNMESIMKVARKSLRQLEVHRAQSRRRIYPKRKGWGRERENNEGYFPHDPDRHASTARNREEIDVSQEKGEGKGDSPLSQ